MLDCGATLYAQELKENLNKVQVDGKVDINLGQQRLGKKVLELKHASLNLDEHTILKRL